MHRGVCHLSSYSLAKSSNLSILTEIVSYSIERRTKRPKLFERTWRNLTSGSLVILSFYPFFLLTFCSIVSDWFPLTLGLTAFTAFLVVFRFSLLFLLSTRHLHDCLEPLEDCLFQVLHAFSSYVVSISFSDADLRWWMFCRILSFFICLRHFFSSFFLLSLFTFLFCSVISERVNAIRLVLIANFFPLISPSLLPFTFTLRFVSPSHYVQRFSTVSMGNGYGCRGIFSEAGRQCWLPWWARQECHHGWLSKDEVNCWIGSSWNTVTKVLNYSRTHYRWNRHS